MVPNGQYKSKGKLVFGDPSELDAVAKKRRLGFYYRGWNSTDCVSSLHQGNGLSASFFVTEAWRNPAEGRLDFDQSGMPILGGHTMTVSVPQFFTPTPLDWPGEDFFVCQNSWGPRWGNRGWAAMTYDFFDRQSYEAWVFSTEAQMPPLFGNGIQHVLWKPKGDHRRQFFVYDIVDVDHDDRLAWAIVVYQRGELHVEDLYVKPHARGRGYGKEMLQKLLHLARTVVGVPLRFWIPFSDVERAEDRDRLVAFFESQDVGLVASPLKGAAYCGLPGLKVSEIPAVVLPPKPAFCFEPRSQPTVDWQAIQEAHGVTDEFMEMTRDVFQQHGEVLKRLA